MTRARLVTVVAIVGLMIGAEAGADPVLDLLTAARHGDVAAIRKAIASGASVNAKDPNFDQTALVRAAMFDKRASVEALLAAKADPNVSSNLGRTALHWAAAAGAADLIPMLVKAGARVEAKDAYDETPLGYAAEASQPAAAKALLAAGARVDGLKKPVASRLSLVIGNGISGASLEVLMALIDSRQGLEVRDELDKRTPLLVAGEYGYRDNSAAVAGALIRAGANRRATDKDGKTALQLVEERLKTEKDARSIANLRATLAALR